MTVEFTAHNVRLDDGTCTKPDVGGTMEEHAWFLSAKRVLDTVFPGDKSQLRLADLGCLEGGFAVEFARMGFQVLGLEVRQLNIQACRYIQERTNLPNLEFVQDDAWNIDKHGTFDAVFCCGLLYHFDKPKRYLELLSKVTKRLLILQTHFAPDSPPAIEEQLPKPLRPVVRPWVKPESVDDDKFHLSPVTENESLRGRWYPEFRSDDEFSERGKAKWASWDNRQSFWIQREYLLQAIHDVGFDLVMEQFDSLAPEIRESMLSGYYKTDSRGTFVGIKTGETPDAG